MTVFLTDGNQRASLAVVRALGEAGVQVTVGEDASPSLAGCSRFCAGQVVYPSPMQGAAFQDFIVKQMESRKYRMLLPMTDITMQLILPLRPQLEACVILPIPDERAIASAHDKRETIRVAQEVGIKFPATFMLREDETIENIAEKISYPAVIKPRFSRFLRQGVWIHGAVQYAYDRRDLVEKYKDSHAQIPFPLVQEKIDGEAKGVFLLIWNGELKAAFCHRRLREKPPWGGVSVYRESLPFNEDLVQKSFSLLKKIGWRGVAMVEFKQDRRDGEAKLMEVNGRFWGSLQLAIDAGMNFPLLLHRLALGADVKPDFNYSSGVKSRWLLGDFDHLLTTLRTPRILNGHTPSRLRAFLDFLKFYEPKLRYEVCRVEDPAPGWWECRSYLHETLGRIWPRRGAR